jgi:hypothetical protein
MLPAPSPPPLQHFILTKFKTHTTDSNTTSSPHYSKTSYDSVVQHCPLKTARTGYNPAERPLLHTPGHARMTHCSKPSHAAAAATAQQAVQAASSCAAQHRQITVTTNTIKATTYAVALQVHLLSNSQPHIHARPGYQRTMVQLGQHLHTYKYAHLEVCS